MRTSLANVYQGIGSTRTSCVLLLVLLVLTYFGTLYQVEYGLFPAQQKYFSSFFLIHWLFGLFPIPLPGAYLVLMALFFNLLFGSILYVRKGWIKLGVLVSHGGMLFLLASAFVAHEFSDTGYLILYEGDSADYFEHAHIWEIVVNEKTEEDKSVANALPFVRFASVSFQKDSTLSSPLLPFKIVINRFFNHCDRVPGAPNISPETETINGFRLLPLSSGRDTENRVPGAYISVDTGRAEEMQRAILWGGSAEPVSVEASGHQYLFSLRRQRSALPFQLTLEKFTHETHPRSTLSRTFRSDLLKAENGVVLPFTITMNEPFRYQGYTFYQSSWGLSGEGSDQKIYSVFAVVKNPAERWPLYACIVITLGMTLHFSQKLIVYLRKERAHIT